MFLMRLSAILVLFYCLIGCKENGAYQTKDTGIILDTSIRVLASGQSNMIGKGIGGLSPVECSQKVKVWNNTNQLGDNGSEFISPPDFGYSPWDVDGGNNLSLWFAHKAADIFQSVNLVLVARGGRPISWWGAMQPVYQEIVEIYTLTKQPSADVFLWHQGESDGEQLTSKENYKIAFLDLIYRLKADAILMPDAIILVGELRDQRAASINAVFQELATENEDIYFVTSGGLEDYDGVHYTGEALYEFGLRYWETYEDALNL